MKRSMLAILLFLVALAIRSEAQTGYAYQGVTRNITTASQYCSSSTRCSIIGSGAAYHQLTWNVSGTLSACSVRVDSSTDGITWGTGDIIAAQTCTSNGQTISISHVVNYVRVNVTTITPVSTANLTVDLIGFVNLPSGGGTVTSIATTSPITGGPITGTGTLACPTCTTNASTLGQGTALISNSGNAIVDSGQPLIPGATYDSTQILTLASGDNALYTVPSGKLAFFRIEGINPTVGSITVFPTITPTGGATIFRVANNTVVSASPGNSAYDVQLQPYLLGSAGDVLGLNCTALGFLAHVEVTLFPIANSSVFKQVLLKTFIVGDNTAYTVPGGKTAYLSFPVLTFSGSAGQQYMYSNQSGGNATIKINIVPSGGSPSASNLILSPAATTTQTIVNVVTVKRMVAGDFININSTSNGQQLFAFYVLETTP